MALERPSFDARRQCRTGSALKPLWIMEATDYDDEAGCLKMASLTELMRSNDEAMRAPCPTGSNLPLIQPKEIETH